MNNKDIKKNIFFQPMGGAMAMDPPMDPHCEEYYESINNQLINATRFTHELKSDKTR